MATGNESLNLREFYDFMAMITEDIQGYLLQYQLRYATLFPRGPQKKGDTNPSDYNTHNA